MKDFFKPEDFKGCETNEDCVELANEKLNALIEAIVKEPCKHEPDEIYYDYTGNTYKCKNCGVELQATWSEVKK